jgi:hypothetical protein
MITNFWLIHLEKIFKKLAQTDNALRMGRNGVQVTDIFAVECSENIVTVLLAIGNKANWGEIC